MDTSNTQSSAPFAETKRFKPEDAERDSRDKIREAEALDENFEPEGEEDDLGDESLKPASPSEVKFVKIDEKYYNRIGFYCAIDSVHNPEDNFKKSLAELQQHAQRRIQQITDTYHHTIKYIHERIAERRVCLINERNNLAHHRAQLGSLLEARDQIAAKMEGINAKLLAANTDVAKKRKLLLDGRLDARFKELENELKKLMEGSQLLAEKKHELNEQIYNDNHEVFEARVTRLTDSKNKVENAYEIIRAKIENLRQAGITHNVVYFMLTFGALGVIAAGWFYSVFILASKLGSEDSLSFFLRRIIGFGDKQFQQGNPLVTLAVFVGVLLGLLALVSVVAGLCHWLLNKKERGKGSKVEMGKEKNEFSLSVNEDEKPTFYAQIKARSIFEFWLQLLPLVLVVGLTFILISLFGPQGVNDLENLLSALEGQFIGAIIALATTGVMILYISRIIEPRLVKDAVGIRWIWQHLELMISVVLSCGLMVFMLYSSAIVNPPNPSALNPSVANASFWVIVLFTALTLGYGIRFRGLHRDARYLERALRSLSIEIENNSRRRPLDIKAILSENFREKFEEIHEGLFDTIINRNAQVAQLYGGTAKPGNPEKPGKSWFYWKEDGGDDKQPEPPTQLHPNEIDEKYFPEEKRIVDNLDDELRTKKMDLEALKEKINALENHDGEVELTIVKKMQAHEASVIELRRRLLRKERAWHRLRNIIELQRKIDETKIKDGYDLGLLFRGKMSGEFYDNDFQHTSNRQQSE